MSAEPGTQNLDVYQGAYWSQTILWKDSTGAAIDTSTYTARMQVRRTFEDPNVVILLETNPKPGGGVGNGRITLGIVEDPPGTPIYNVLLEIEATATDDLPATLADRVWRYDLELVPAGGQVRRLLMGKFKVWLEVTR